MNKINCTLRLSEVPLHLYQIIAGFTILDRQGVVNLTFEYISPQSNQRLPYNMMEVIIDNEIKVLYDLNDGYDNWVQNNKSYIENYNELLENYDYCFKRSFSDEYNKPLMQMEKMHKLGLNYMVTTKGNRAGWPAPCDPIKEKVKKMYRKIPFTQYYDTYYRVNSFEDFPKKVEKPRILFIARLWDTNANLSKEKLEERKYINETRIQCLKRCNVEFGDQFFGGFSADDFAVQEYPELIIRDSKITKRHHYLKKVKDASICIATMGLHESIGWKFAEYVAASKAIVTEKLRYQVPGDLFEGNNFLSFNNADECIEKINVLLNDKNLLYNMMLNNYRYYHNHVRPDRLVFNTIITALNYSNNIKLNNNQIYSIVDHF